MHHYHLIIICHVTLCTSHLVMCKYIYADMYEKPPDESIKAFKPYLRGFAKSRCFPLPVVIVIFRFCAILWVMETLLLKEKDCFQCIDQCLN